ncbi:MAG TPA: PhoH family protein, partial [Bacteroidota bacterium]|nr:PhoH family protein [Bacteroidota bacterium]
MIEKKIRLEGVDTLDLLGLNDANLQVLENRFDANIYVRGGQLTIRGSQTEVEQIEKVVREMM